MTPEYQVHPLGTWLEPKTSPRRGAHLFRATWADTLDLLGRELDYLDATRVVLQIDVAETAIRRRDGMLRADARANFPGVRLSFGSKHGPLTYATDAYDRFQPSRLEGWQANVRAIALGLEALRAVDRYGVTRRGEQYRGWTALAATAAVMTRGQAAEFIAHWAGWRVKPDDIRRLLTDPDERAAAYRHAAKRAHPDAGGDTDTMARLNAARDLLDGDSG